MTAAAYYDGTSLRPRAVTLAVEAGQLRIRGDDVDRSVSLESLRTTSRLANVRRAIHLPDGAQVQCDDNDWVDRLFPRRGMEALVDRLERHAAAVAASIVAIAACAIAFFTIGLPWIAEKAARAIPESALEVLGEQTLKTMDEAGLEPSRLDPADQARVRDAFGEFVRGMPGAERYRVEFRRIGTLPNAFALPGGTIVVTDAIVNALPQPEAMVAVLAHEVGHQVGRHVMRRVIEASAVGLIAALLASDVSSASAIVLGVPVFLLHGHYSRDFERDADAYAVDALRARGVSPEWFAYALERIDAASLSDKGNGADTYVSSHPMTAARVATARAQAQGFDALEDLNATSIARVFGPGIEASRDRQVGCWSGRRKTTDDTDYRWYSTFGDDGNLEVDFEYFDKADKVVSRSYEAGRWALRNGILSARMTSNDSQQIDRLESYRVERLDDETETYVLVPGGTTFEAARIDCADDSDD